jgi:predicted PurR-regulated permease PerM
MSHIPEPPPITQAPEPRASDLGTYDVSTDVVRTEPTLTPTQDLESSPELLATGMFFTLFTISIVSLIYLFSGFVTDLILALVFAAMTVDSYRRLVPKVGGRPWLASLITCLIFVVLAALPITFLVTSLSAEAAHAFDATKNELTAEQVQEFLFGSHPVATTIRGVTGKLGIEFTPDSVRAAITGFAGGVAAYVYTQLNALLSNVLKALFHFGIIVVGLFYLLIDGKRLKKFLFRLSPLPSHEEELLAVKFGNVGRAILVGNGVGSVLQGTFGAIAMWVVGFSSPILWGTVMSVFAFLPLIGIGVVTVPATLYLAIIGRQGSALFFFVTCTAASFVIENVLKTRLIGSHMQMHDLLIFMSLIAGITTFGVIGILYGPLLVTLFLTLAELYEAHYRNRFARHLAHVAGVSPDANVDNAPRPKE